LNWNKFQKWNKLLSGINFKIGTNFKNRTPFELEQISKLERALPSTVSLKRASYGLSPLTLSLVRSLVPLGNGSVAASFPSFAAGMVG
jgi:hypothetical protein